VFSVWVCVLVFGLNLMNHILKAIKRILRYLKHAADLTLWYPKGCNFDLVEYADADYAGFLVDSKSRQVWLTS